MINAINERHQTPKLTKFQLKLKISKSEPNWLSIALKYGMTTHLQLNL